MPGLHLLKALTMIVGALAAPVSFSANNAVYDASSATDPRFFNRVASFAICMQPGQSCDSSDETAAEIVAATEDGRLLVYSNSPRESVGFVDLSRPEVPVGLGELALEGEPTSVAIHGPWALVAVNTSSNYTQPSGQLVVVELDRRRVVAQLALPGQPDAIAVSPDGRYAAIAIENERDEDIQDGALPQLPGGSLAVVDIEGSPSSWTIRNVRLTGLSDIAPEDPEPEYVAINRNNRAAITLQENNHIVVVNLELGVVESHFSAGSVNLMGIDATDAPRPNRISLTESQTELLREPDGVTWVGGRWIATANEGDWNGGSRGFTVFGTDGQVQFDSGNLLERLAARVGHHNDRRADSKGNEPENIAFARYRGQDLLFVVSERSSLIFVFDISDPKAPVHLQPLPAALAPEGILPLPQRDLLIVASEADERESGVRSALNIYRHEIGETRYPTLASANDSRSNPIGWGALSGLTTGHDGTTLYSIEDSFYGGNRIFEIDTRVRPHRITRTIPLTDPQRVLSQLAADLPDAANDQAFDDADLATVLAPDGRLNLDPEGIAMAPEGGFWIVSEGRGSVNDKDHPVKSANLLLRVDSEGVLQQVFRLPTYLEMRQSRFGLEGVTVAHSKVIVALQRPWGDDAGARIGIFDPGTGDWTFAQYPLNAPASPNGGWVGISGLVFDGERVLVLERDNQAGPDARIKRIYSIDASELMQIANPDGSMMLRKQGVADLLPAINAQGGLTPEKFEGISVDRRGEIWVVNDNDGVHDNSGETLLLNLGRITQ